jgi:hypothetical protein
MPWPLNVRFGAGARGAQTQPAGLVGLPCHRVVSDQPIYRIECRSRSDQKGQQVCHRIFLRARDKPPSDFCVVIEARHAVIWYMYHQRGATKAAFAVGSEQSILLEACALNRLTVAKPPLFRGCKVQRR